MNFKMQRIGRAGFSAWLLLTALAVGFAQTQETGKETVTERRQRLLAKVRRLAVVPPFFGVPLADANPAPKKNEKKGDAKKAEAARKIQEEYRAYRVKLEASAREHLPLRLAARTAFHSVPLAETEAALKALQMTPQSLFQRDGLMRGTTFPLFNPDAVKKLAAQLQADAVLLTVLDAPRREGGRVFFDPLAGLTGDPPDVRSKGGFYLLLPDGTEVLHAYVEALHPVTAGGHAGRDYLLIDWTEAQDVMLEDFMDELSRYAPVSGG